MKKQTTFVANVEEKVETHCLNLDTGKPDFVALFQQSPRPACAI